MSTKLSLRDRMERSATYLAAGHEGREGLDPATVEYSLWCIGEWKKYFVKYMIGKENTRDGGVLDKAGAGKLADNIFLAFYNQEVRAFLEPTKGPYNEREPGALEYGDLSELFTDHRDALDRDENRNHWKQVQVSRVNTPWKRKQENYAYLLQALVKKKSVKKTILRNANQLRMMGAITWNHWIKLNAHSAVI